MPFLIAKQKESSKSPTICLQEHVVIVSKHLLNESRNWTRTRNIVGKVVSFNLILQKAPFGGLFCIIF